SRPSSVFAGASGAAVACPRRLVRSFSSTPAWPSSASPSPPYSPPIFFKCSYARLARAASATSRSWPAPALGGASDGDDDDSDGVGQYDHSPFRCTITPL